MAGAAMTGRGRDGRRARPLLRTMIGDVLRHTRRAQRRTLADVSRAARVSVPYLSEIERGRKEASSEVLAAICDALRIDLSELLGGVTHTLADGASDRAAVRPLGASRDGEVVRLDLARTRRARPQAQGPGDTVCLLAA
jgi:transcriptional regulator with XRE-family HTH domain